MLDALRVLVFVVVKGTGPAPGSSPRVRSTVVLGAALAVFFAIVPVTPVPSATGGLVVVVGGLLAALPALAVLWRPLVAWRLAVLQLLVAPLVYAPHVDLSRMWGWPWTMGLSLTAASVLYLVAETNEKPVLLQVWALTTAAVAPHLPDWRNLLLVAALAAGVVLLGNAVRLRRQADHRRLVEQSKAHALEERARIARELHDVVSHHMSALVLRADAAAYRLPDLTPEVRAEFDVVQRMARDGLAEMRRMLGVLRSPDDAPGAAPQPGPEDVAGMVARFRATGAEVALRVDGDLGRLPAGVGLSAYRIVQEALSNSGRHAPGAAVSVELAVVGGRLRVTARNAAGLRPALDVDPARPRHGLVGMGERVRALGGGFSAGPTPDGGFAVVADLPLDEGGDG
ncbi:histidine kinase [Catellatospora bangladeshensis]